VLDVFNKIIDYIKNNNIKNSNNQLNIWYNINQKYYNNKEFIMENKIIYDKWTEFINCQKYEKTIIKNNNKRILQENENIQITQNINNDNQYSYKKKKYN